MPLPNFTGRWKLNLQRSNLQIPPPDSSSFVVEHGEPRFRLTRTHVYAGVSNTVSFSGVTDGQERAQDFGELQARIRMNWDAGRLVAEMFVRTADDEGTNTVRYSLEDGGSTFVALEQWRSHKHHHDNRWVFERVD